jgi:predicted nucleotidyltransferase
MVEKDRRSSYTTTVGFIQLFKNITVKIQKFSGFLSRMTTRNYESSVHFSYRFLYFLYFQSHNLWSRSGNLQKGAPYINILATPLFFSSS